MITYNEFEDKVAFITGAASGIGKAQAEAFLATKAKVFAVDIDSAITNLFDQKNSNLETFIGDISQSEICQQAVTSCHEKFGPVDILLNTAGKLDAYKPLLETDASLWHHILETNLNSLFYLTKEILPDMILTGSGSIINMASIAGLVAGGGGISYTTSKHAIIGFTKQLALDYADKGIRVKAIAPGAIETSMNAADFAGDGELAKWVAEETPVKRWAQPEEVAHLTLFLASQQASYLQGAVIPIDGGWLLK